MTEERRCERCGRTADFWADGKWWCGVGHLEFARRGIKPSEEPLSLRDFPPVADGGPERPIIGGLIG